MKEMTWTREEALKRLATVFQDAENGARNMAIGAMEAMTEEQGIEMLKMARDRKHSVIGMIMAADALDISMEELRNLEVPEEAANEFMKELEHRLDERRENKNWERGAEVASGLPDWLKEGLKAILE